MPTLGLRPHAMGVALAHTGWDATPYLYAAGALLLLGVIVLLVVRRRRRHDGEQR